MSWHRSTLASLVSVLESGSRPKGGVSAESGDIPSLGGENILRSGGVTLDGVKRVPRKFYEQMTKGHLTDMDVLINKDGAQTGKVGLYRDQDGMPFCINEHLFSIRGTANKITQEYLYYTLLSEPSQNQIDAQISGSAQPGLKSDFLQYVFAEIPEALSEQTKIVEILLTLDQAIEQAEALIAKHQRIKTGLMQDLLTHGIDENGDLRSEETHEFKDSPLGRIPVEWDTRRFADIAPNNAPIGYGIVQPGSYDYTGIKVAGIYTINSSFQEWHMSAKRIEQAYTRSRIRPGDILLSIKGTTGRIGVVPEGTTGNITRDIARIRPIEEINPHYLRYLMLSDFFQRYLGNAEVGTTRAEISIKILRDLYIIKPPTPEQDEIVNRVGSIEQLINQDNIMRDKLKSLKTGLMQDLLTGKVSVTPLLAK